MQQTEVRKPAAIIFTDIVGFSRQMGANEARMLRLLDSHTQLIRQAVANPHGTVIKTVGDAFLVEFPCGRHCDVRLSRCRSERDVGGGGPPRDPGDPFGLDCACYDHGGIQSAHSGRQ